MVEIPIYSYNASQGPTEEGLPSLRGPKYKGHLAAIKPASLHLPEHKASSVLLVIQSVPQLWHVVVPVAAFTSRTGRQRTKSVNMSCYYAVLITSLPVHGDFASACNVAHVTSNGSFVLIVLCRSLSLISPPTSAQHVCRIHRS